MRHFNIRGLGHLKNRWGQEDDKPAFGFGWGHRKKCKPDPEPEPIEGPTEVYIDGSWEPGQLVASYTGSDSIFFIEGDDADLFANDQDGNIYLATEITGNEFEIAERLADSTPDVFVYQEGAEEGVGLDVVLVTAA